MGSIKKNLKQFKVPLIAFGALFGLMIVVSIGRTIYSSVQHARVKDVAITGISATNDTQYSQGDTIAIEDFSINATYENGVTLKISSDECSINTTAPEPVGDTTVVTITLDSTPQISCEVTVSNEREEVARFYCGNPTLEDVAAVLYSNGELCFEGTGDVTEYDTEFPWRANEDSDEENSYVITSVTFEETVTPSSMDNWFVDMTDINYVAHIPTSVVSMRNTFYGCTGLITAPEWDGCTNLLDVTSCYQGCTSLTYVPALPENVSAAESMCEGCTSMQTAPDLTGATSLILASRMFYECNVLTSVTMPPNCQDISYMFAECVNLRAMPEIPETTTNMEGTFQRNLSLSYLTLIPAQVTNVQDCFNGCQKISGILWVEANPTEYENFMLDAAYATNVDLQGPSSMLNELALTAVKESSNGDTTNPFVTVYGGTPVEPVDE